jgi:hypothetical protein
VIERGVPEGGPAPGVVDAGQLDEGGQVRGGNLEEAGSERKVSDLTNQTKK